MAISGTLSQMSLTQVLSLLKRRVGVLTLSELDNFASCEFYVNKDELQALRIDDHDITEDQAVKTRLTELVHLTEGSFAFKECAINNETNLQLSIRKLLLEAKFDVIRSKTIDDSLASPQTRFCRTNEEVALENEQLRRFYKLIQHRLKTGVSAEEITQHLKIELRNAQIGLYKLRLLKVVEPVKAYQQQNRNATHATHAKPLTQTSFKPVTSSPSSISSKRPSLVRRLIQALRTG